VNTSDFSFFFKPGSYRQVEASYSLKSIAISTALTYFKNPQGPLSIKQGGFCDILNCIRILSFPDERCPLFLFNFFYGAPCLIFIFIYFSKGSQCLNSRVYYPVLGFIWISILVYECHYQESMHTFFYQNRRPSEPIK